MADDGDGDPNAPNIMRKGQTGAYNYYYSYAPANAMDENVVVRVGSKEDTQANRAQAAKTDPNWNQGTGAYVSQFQPFDVRFPQTTQSQTSSNAGSINPGGTNAGYSNTSTGVSNMATPNVGTGANPRPVDEYMGEQAVNPLIPQQGLFVPDKQTIGSDELITDGTGQVTGTIAPATTLASVTQAAGAAPTAAQQYTAATVGSAPTVNTAQGTVSPDALVQAQQGAITQPAQGAQGQLAGTINPLTGRAVSAQEQSQAAQANTAFLTPYQAAQSGFVSNAQGATMQVTPNMTVEGQLARLSTQFSGGQVPAWAAGAIRLSLIHI